ncbi:MAG TPA: FIST N-terminal domain-containing protein [Aliidongia sp.]|uniref:FIST signal transduction protein n=1 Tax=Aliidongia sp. TaxID=1914230 RepID=UPI002DDC9DEF|nr:FIST N-terminal domain-containing protein [Aliidongia sp.]HEV2673608.1 FIST N-terminal domain-containing protein [Aliidongia sp.]
MTGAFRLGHAGGEDWQVLYGDCLAQITPLPADANFGLLYVTDLLAGELPGILDRLKRDTGIAVWVGAVGIGICATGVEYMDEPALAFLVGALPAGSFRLFALDQPDPPSALTRPAPGGERLSTGLVHGDPRFGAVAETVAAVAGAAQAYLIGGLSSARTAPWQVAGKVVESGVSGVLFDDRIELVTGMTQGCSPIGPVRRITAGVDNIISEIDGQPALEIFKRDIGELLSRDLQKVGGLIFAGLPVPGTDRADYLVRNLLAIDQGEGWIAIAGPVAPGDAILFCRRDRAAATADLDRMVDDVVRRAGGRAKGGVYFSCVGRGPGFFGGEGVEMAAIQERLPDLPLVGFFGNGEIVCDRIYGYTGVLALFL